jgi:hypothetical protein
VEFPPFRGRFTAWDSSRALRWLQNGGQGVDKSGPKGSRKRFPCRPGSPLRIAYAAFGGFSRTRL